MIGMKTSLNTNFAFAGRLVKRLGYVGNSGSLGVSEMVTMPLGPLFDSRLTSDDSSVA